MCLYKEFTRFLQNIFNFGCFLTFDGCDMEGFVAIEDRPLVTKEIGPDGGKLTTDYDNRMEAAVLPGIIKQPTNVKMMVNPYFMFYIFKKSSRKCIVSLSQILMLYGSLDIDIY